MGRFTKFNMASRDHVQHFDNRACHNNLQRRWSLQLEIFHNMISAVLRNFDTIIAENVLQTRNFHNLFKQQFDFLPIPRFLVIFICFITFVSHLKKRKINSNVSMLRNSIPR